MPIAERVAELHADIAQACASAGRTVDTVNLIAVTKSQGPEVLEGLAAAGIRAVGENRLEHHALMHAVAPVGLAFHAIGRLQGRQLAKLVPLSVCVHGLCDADHVQRLERACADQQRRMHVFLQVNTSGESSKAGLEPEALPPVLDLARSQPHLEVLGLMTMAPERDEGADEATIRRCFSACRELARRHGLERLSMGMSQDFAWAIAEGATDVRIGTRLFG
jgi:pyridoxal phosphate enzyme (YggS family)